jgi:ATP-dependent Lhr-like helicase
VSPEQFVRFLTRWQHVAPGTQVSTVAGLGRILEQLQGWEAAVASWEPDLLARRIRDYQPRWIDQRCHDGEIQWLRLSPRVTDDPDRRGTAPSKATPVSLVYRDDLPWLLAAVRGDAEAPLPTCGAVAEIAEVLAAKGACFLTELATDTGRLASDVERGLWDGVARGLFTADGFEAVRALTTPHHRPDSRERALSKLRRSGVRSAHAAGRWSLVPPPAEVESRDDLVEAAADQLLQRWGVVFYDLVAHENLAIPWRELQWALRRYEDRGLVKGGRFVGGFSGEQFALPEAVQGLDAVRTQAPTGRTVTVCGSDPLNLTGVILPGDRIPARRTETVELPV